MKSVKFPAGKDCRVPEIWGQFDTWLASPALDTTASARDLRRMNKLRLLSATMTIESPRIFNETLVLDWFAQLRKEIPASIAAIAIDGAPFTDDAGMSDQDYIAAALKIDRIYQLAARWILLDPWRSQLALRRKNDVRA